MDLKLTFFLLLLSALIYGDIKYFCIIYASLIAVAMREIFPGGQFCIREYFPAIAAWIRFNQSLNKW